MIINEAQQKLLETTKKNATKELPNVTILYASQTGNAAAVAQKLHDQLANNSVPVTLTNMLDYRPKNLKKETHLIIVASTYGDGEAPDEALSFYKTIMGDKAPNLCHLSYSIFSLGDSTYDLFCQTGIEFDERFETLGANRLLERVDADIDYDETATQWINAITSVISDSESPSETNKTTGNAAIQNWSENQPFSGEVLNIIDLTDDLSDKNVWHLEIGIDESGIHYLPGDIIALLPENDTELVHQLIETTKLSADESVLIKDEKYSLKDALVTKLDITSLNRKLVESYAELTTLTPIDLAEIDIEQLIESGDLLDLIQAKPSPLSAQGLVDLLRPLRSRQYSIASSQSMVDDEVHVTVKQVAYKSLKRERKGVCSNWLAKLTEGDSVPLYIKTNNSFKLPTDNTAKIIMVGAGTGIAPFRSFLQERDDKGLMGNTWLFFGEQHFKSDFLYQTEWQKHVKTGVLEKISLAFSRDQEEKIYVQNRIVEQAETLFEWLENGASIYVCGDRNHMAKDVHNAFIEVITEQGQKSTEEAEEYLQELVTKRRYQRDIY
jgi:sulfite reductase (NADPH) flavoprotein alpha-component